MTRALIQTLGELAGASSVRFGTSGVRGLVADLSPEICRAYTQAFLRTLGLSGGSVLLGHDLRPSSPKIARACASEARVNGFEPINAGVLPTPALAYAAQEQRLPAMMITGSHIPFDRNGIKFYSPLGEITKANERAMLACSLRDTPTQLTHDLPSADPAIIQFYLRRYLDVFPTGALSGLRVGVYEHSSVARDLLHEVLRRLGANTLSLGRSDNFIPIDTEAVREEDRNLGREWASSHALDAIVTTDGDADRPLIADERGVWIRGDVVGILCSRALSAATVVTPVSSNTALEACGIFPSTIRTRIGSPHVIAAMEAASDAPIVGYEANGGFLLGSDVSINGRCLGAFRTRDALLPMLLLLATIRTRACKISDLVSELPERHTFSDRLQDVDVAACRSLLERLEKDHQGLTHLAPASSGSAAAIDTTDGVRATFTTGDILHLRISGNAPELRCYAEAKSEDHAKDMCVFALAAVQGLL